MKTQTTTVQRLCFWTLPILMSMITVSTLTVTVSAQAVTSPVQRSKTPGGVEYGIWNKTDDKPAPTLFVLSGTIDSTLGSAYFRQCGNGLARHDWISVSIDLPCHGSQAIDGEPSGLAGWSHRAAKEVDFVAECNNRLSEVLDHLIKTGVADPDRIAACGTSRGGFLAVHFQAHDQRVKCAAAFAPVTDLAMLSEFRGVKKNPFVLRLSLERRAEELAGRPLWVVIGDRDERVSTDAVIRFARGVTAASLQKKLSALVDLHVIAEPKGHTVPKGYAEIAAAWFRKQFPEERE